MWILISAVVTASLLGSMHCVGMCGPLAIWASGAGEGRRGKQLAVATALYHVGRLLTYALAGLIAGAAGQLVDVGGQALGVQLVAARLVGSLMIVIGGVRLWQLLGRKKNSASSNLIQPGAPQGSLITRALVRLRPFVFRLPVPARGLATGLLTALLPCGWLYLFALFAAGTGSIITSPLVMVAFWIGTVPALVTLVSGTQFLAVRFRTLVPVAAAILLILGGGYTASGRGFASLNSLADIQVQGLGESTSPDVASAEELASSVDALVKTPLPCCEGKPVSQPAHVEAAP
ncbi:MAG: sulfite exporter TauE/SafE family protein [Pirellulaceae bacterium]